MEETSEEQTTGAVTRELKPDRQGDSRLLPTEREGIKTAKMLTKNATRSGKISYMIKLINVINKQVLDESETRQVEFNLQSFMKAMANFQQSNGEYVAVLGDSGEIERAFESLLSTEDSFQQCMARAE